jgi:3-methyladenine DNA glycosylase AlkC
MPFADELMGERVVAALTSAMRGAAPALPFTQLRSAEIAPLSLRERSDLLRDALLADVPGDYALFVATVRVAMRDAAFTGWLIWPVTSAIALKATAEGTNEAFDDGLALLGTLTSRLSSEFAIRSLLAHDLDRSLAIIRGWTTSDDAHLRRLASEGTRPFLPWARRVPAILARPELTVPLLDALYRDESDYVRRSVANHVNDLARQHPELAVAATARWLADPDENTAQLVRHALRTLIKNGNAEALSQLGFAPATVDVSGLRVAAAAIQFGGTVSFSASIRNGGSESARLAVDYVMHHQKANGTLTTKTFKLTTATLAPGETLAIARDHSFRTITTRKYYAGEHAIGLQVNGVNLGEVAFTVLPAQD